MTQPIASWRYFSLISLCLFLFSSNFSAKICYLFYLTNCSLLRSGLLILIIFILPSHPHYIDPIDPIYPSSCPPSLLAFTTLSPFWFLNRPPENSLVLIFVSFASFSCVFASSFSSSSQARNWFSHRHHKYAASTSKTF